MASRQSHWARSVLPATSPAYGLQMYTRFMPHPLYLASRAPGTHHPACPNQAGFGVRTSLNTVQDWLTPRGQRTHPTCHYEAAGARDMLLVIHRLSVA